MIPKTKIETVLNEADIVKIVGDQIPLQKKGRNYFAVCPFHNDTNPSMVVSREKKIYKCFSCGAHGNAIKFVENYSHLSFLEALKTVAKTTSIDLTKEFETLNYSIDKYSAEQKILFQINEEALMFFKVTLFSRLGQKPLNYLKQRNLTATEIEIWELGWSTSQASLSTHLLNKGYTVEQLKAASLISIKNNEIHDYFNNRLIFPIRDLDNNLIGFSGRSLHDSKEVKYLNIRETVAFQKSRILFNINHALMAINKTKTVIITEGFMDVFSLSRIGFPQTIATMGTNFSDFHVSTLKKLQAEIILFFDGDKAGVRANLKTASKLMSQKLRIKIVDNLTALDPDELVKNHKEETVKELIVEALNPWDYAFLKLQTLYDISNYDQLRQFLEEIFNLLRVNDEPIMVNQILNKLSRLTNLHVDVLAQSYLQSKSTAQFTKSRSTPATKNDSTLPSSILPYRDILFALASDPKYIGVVEENWDLIYQTIEPEYIGLIIVLKTLIERYRAQIYHPKNWDELNEVLKNASFNFQDTSWNLTQQWFRDTKNKDLTPALLALEEKYWRQKEAYYRAKIFHTHDQETLQNYLLQKNETRKKILDLKRKRNEWQWKK